MQYKIHEVAKMLGLSPQTVRFYEQYGIKPGSREDGGIRQYDNAGIDVMMSMRKLRNCGFTVAETAQLLHAEDTPAIVAAFDRRCDELEKQIAREQRILEALRRTQAHRRHLRSLPGEMRVMLRPAMVGRLFIPRGEKQLAKDRMQALSRWASEMPLIRWVNEYSPTGRPQEESLPNRGFVTGGEMADFLGLSDDPELVHFPACRCVEGILSWNAKDKPQHVAVGEFCDRIAAMGYVRNGSPLSCTIINTATEDGTVTSGEIWVPVADPSEGNTD